MLPLKLAANSIYTFQRLQLISDTYCIVLPCAVGLPRVRKPNVRMEFNVYVNSQSDASVQHRRVCDSLFYLLTTVC